MHSTEPLNAEPPLEGLRKNVVTDEIDFYIRSHDDTPVIGTDTHAINSTGLFSALLSLSLIELKGRFARGTMSTAIQRVGNRRADRQGMQPATGNLWACDAIGNALVRLFCRQPRPTSIRAGTSPSIWS